MIDLLILIEAFVEVVFTLRVRPEHVPIVAIRRHKTVDLKDEAYEL